MSNLDTVAAGRVVSMQYTLTLDDGQIVDKTEGEESLDYLHGAGNIVPGLEQALEGQSVGNALKVRVEPDQAYGAHSNEAVQDVDRSAFPEDAQLEVGVTFQAMDQDGNPILGTITAMAGDQVTVDFNHPLAGKPLNFEVKIVAIRAATDEEQSHGHAHGAGGHEH